MQGFGTAVAVATAALAGGAQAHVVLAPDTAAAGAYYAGVLRVSHGCDGSPTRSLRVEIPVEAASAKPQPKPGWTLKVERAPRAQPITGEGGATIRDRVIAITWTGELPDGEFDTFGLMLRAPAAAGPLYLPTVQTCAQGANRWVERPAAGQARRDLARPAPVLTLTPPTGSVAAEHHH